MKAYIHWVGNQFYSIPSFIYEAKKLGVSRRVSTQTLKKMEWGDKVYLISREKDIKHPVIFGWFKIDKLHGIDTSKLPDDLKPKVVINTGSGHRNVRRGCGFVVETGVYAVTEASVEELSDYSTENTMIKGGLKVFPEPYPMMVSITAPFRGFRLFNEQEFIKALKWLMGLCPIDEQELDKALKCWTIDGKRPRLKGYFYV